jgi:putative membrane protein
MDANKSKGNTTDHLANERTFLAWMRTSIGIMAFGFVVVKFSLFVKRIALLFGKTDLNPPATHGLSAIVGIVLVLVGTITLIFS